MSTLESKWSDIRRVKLQGAVDIIGLSCANTEIQPKFAARYVQKTQIRMSLC